MSLITTPELNTMGSVGCSLKLNSFFFSKIDTFFRLTKLTYKVKLNYILSLNRTVSYRLLIEKSDEQSLKLGVM